MICGTQTLQHTTAYCNILQHTATHCNAQTAGFEHQTIQMIKGHLQNDDMCYLFLPPTNHDQCHLSLQPTPQPCQHSRVWQTVMCWSWVWHRNSVPKKQAVQKKREHTIIQSTQIWEDHGGMHRSLVWDWYSGPGVHINTYICAFMYTSLGYHSSFENIRTCAYMWSRDTEQFQCVCVRVCVVVWGDEAQRRETRLRRAISNGPILKLCVCVCVYVRVMFAYYCVGKAHSRRAASDNPTL